MRESEVKTLRKFLDDVEYLQKDSEDYHDLENFAW